MKNNQIDIIVPTLNSSDTLESTLLSLSRLKLFGISANILIVDSGSIDGTQEIVKNYKFKIDFFPKGNMYAAINYGLGIGKSPWCSYLNSDDIIYPAEFSKIIKYAEKEKANITYGNIDFIDADGRFMHSWNSPGQKKLNSLFKIMVNPIPQPGTIFRRDIHEILNGFNEKYKYLADYDFFLRAFLIKEKIIKYYGKPIAAFRIHENQFTQKYIKKMYYEAKDIFAQRIDKCNYFSAIFTKLNFKISNIPNYIIRILRSYQLNRSFIIPKTTLIHDIEGSYKENKSKNL